MSRLGPVVRASLGPEEERKTSDDGAHLVSAENSDAVNEPGSIDGSNLGDVDDAGAGKSCLTPLQAHVSWHGAKPEIRRNCRDHRGGNRASIEAIVLYDECGPTPCRS